MEPTLAIKLETLKIIADLMAYVFTVGYLLPMALLGGIALYKLWSMCK